MALRNRELHARNDDFFLLSQDAERHRTEEIMD